MTGEFGEQGKNQQDGAKTEMNRDFHHARGGMAASSVSGISLT
jgi:hypothetical protein